MAQNHVKGGDTYEVQVDAAVKSGDVVAVGKVGDIVTIDGATGSGKAAQPEVAADPKGKIVVGFVLNPLSSASTKYAVKLTQAWL